MFYFRCIFYTFYTNTGKMITDRIKALFNFIEYLHSNIDNFNKYNELIKELEFIKAEKNKLNPENNYKDKIKFDELQTELESKFKRLQEKTVNHIKAKAKELEVCNFDNEPNYSFNNVENEIYQLKKSFKNVDLPEIFKHKIQYHQYRTSTHKNFLSLGFFFNDLDRILKDLFDFFKESEQNEFEAFETKTIKVNSQNKVFELYSKGYKEFKFEIIESYSLPDLSNGIFDLTFQNLVDYGLSIEHTSELLNTKGKYQLKCNEGNFFVSEEDKKVYTGIEFYRKTYFENGSLRFPYNCPDLVNEYFDLALTEFLENQKTILGKLFNKNDQYDKFILKEIERSQQRIKSQKEFLSKNKHHTFKSKENDIQICETYIHFLKSKSPQQPETSNPDEAYKNQNLFKVGLLFAKGEMNKYFKVNSKNKTVMNYEFSAPKIAKELGNNSYNKYILSSINNYTTDKENGNKNIFNSFDMMTKIISHCEVNNIPVDAYFKSRLPIE
jgi:hypothetical protein